MKIYTKKDLRGGITLITENHLFRVAYIHTCHDVDVEVGDFALVNAWLYVVTERQYITYQNGEIMSSIHLLRFRLIEALGIIGFGVITALITGFEMTG